MRSLGRWLVSVACAALFLAPLSWLVLASFRESNAVFQPGIAFLTSPGWTLDNYANAWRRAHLDTAIVTTVLQVALIAGLGLFINALCAYAFARLEFRGRELLFSLVVALMVLPVETLALPLFLTARDLGLTGGRVDALAALTLPFMAKAFNIYFLRQQFLSLPRTLEEAAVLDGASVLRQFWSIALPSVKPALITVALLDLLVHWSDFLWPLLVATRESSRTVQIGLANLFTEPPIDWGAILACAVIATLPVLAFFHWFQRHVVALDPTAGIR